MFDGGCEQIKREVGHLFPPFKFLIIVAKTHSFMYYHLYTTIKNMDNYDHFLRSLITNQDQLSNDSLKMINTMKFTV